LKAALRFQKAEARVLLYLLLTLICLYSPAPCGAQEKEKTLNTPNHDYTNNLIQETSPYLLQHAHNPVDWYPWGDEALEKAKKENKPMLVSIGYAACHWCHVMEHESFEDEEVARFMNEHFVAIKVDREERPDIDQVYMNAVQLLTGGGGWPLNCFALPDGRPFYGGTYFPKSQWMELLKNISAVMEKDPGKVEHQAALLTRGVQTSDKVQAAPVKADFSRNDLDRLFAAWKNDLDYTHGGHLRAPKFPLPSGFMFLLHYDYLSRNNDAKTAVITTLDKMADGGIYDQAGGGFARYSVDELWRVPHFEKMLYDNAQLVSLYSAAFQSYGNPKYETIARETLDFIQREMTSDEGGFYSSLDADSEGEEGKYYVWTKGELQKILGDNTELILDYYNVTDTGNWENGRNILFKTVSDEKISAKYNLTEEGLANIVSEAKQVLLRERSRRIRPGLDDKILTAWNALMLKAYVDAYRVFGDAGYLDAALKNADFINTRMRGADYRLSRNYKNGKASINAFLDDYAFTIDAFISLYQATFDIKWLNDALCLTEYAVAHFYDDGTGVFYYTSDIDPPLVARKMEISDNVIPSSNSQMAKNLYILGHYYTDIDYLEKAERMLNSVKQNALEGGAYFANWSILMAWFADPPYEVAILGKDFEAKRKELDKLYLPNVYLSGGAGEGKLSLHKNRFIPGQTTIYVCRDKTCKLPVIEVKEALKQIAGEIQL